MELCPGQIVIILTFLAPMILGVLVGALIMSIKTRRDSDGCYVIILLKFKDGKIFRVKCKQKDQTIFCPICSFRNKKPYKMSKHLKGHLKKDEGKELFTH